MVFNIVNREFAKLDKFTDIMVVGDLLPSQAAAKAGLTDAVYDYIKSLGVLSAAEMTFAQKAKLTTIALKEQAAAFIASPLGKTAIIVAGILAVVAIVDKLTTSLEESREKLSTLKDEYNTNESELSSLNGELETTEERIKTLQALKDAGTISFTEQEELDKLIVQNNELQRSIDLLNTQQSLKQAQINQTFAKTMEMDIASPHVSWDSMTLSPYTLSFKDSLRKSEDPNFKEVISIIRGSYEKHLVERTFIEDTWNP